MAILAGGIGSRLWPLSTVERPKPFLNPLPEVSPQMDLLARTCERHTGLTAHAMVVAGTRYAQQVKRSVAVLPAPQPIFLAESEGRNTAAAVLLAALQVARDCQRLLVVPADAWIRNREHWRKAVMKALQVVQKSKTFAVLGVHAEWPATGYGYVQAVDSGIAPLRRFIEKPARAQAEEFLAAGCFYWNAGVFAFDIDYLLNRCRQHCADIVEGVQRYLASGAEADYRSIRAESIDYAVMERIGSEGTVVPVDAGWSDLGNLESWWQVRVEAGLEPIDAPLVLGVESVPSLPDANFILVRGSGGLLMRSRHPH